MSQTFEEYVQERLDKQMVETARTLLKNGASIELVRKSIPTLSLEFIEELNEQIIMEAKQLQNENPHLMDIFCQMGI